eukprot:gene18748-20637_t
MISFSGCLIFLLGLILLASCANGAEGTVNSRPLGFIYSDDLEEPITPSHLVIGRRILSLPYPDELDDEDDDYDATVLEKRARYLRTLLGHFWKRWTDEYLINLREQHSSKEVNEMQQSVKRGDVVIVKDVNLPRGRWKVAVVEELIVSEDKQVRGAVIRLVNTKGTFTRLRRSVQHLYPIEVTANDERGKKLSKFDDIEETEEFKANGCSVPGNMNAPFKKTFTPACNDHDYCYYHKKQTRRYCDTRFLLKMVFTCEKRRLKNIKSSRASKKRPSSSRRFKNCVKFANLYFLAVRFFGGWYY